MTTEDRGACRTEGSMGEHEMVSADEAREMLAETTAGPWCVAMMRDEKAVRDEIGVIAKLDPRSYEKPDGTWHGTVICRGMDGPTREPNAQLIAAAPDLARTVIALHAALARAEERATTAEAARDALLAACAADCDAVAEEHATRLRELEAEGISPHDPARLCLVVAITSAERCATKIRARGGV